MSLKDYPAASLDTRIDPATGQQREYHVLSEAERAKGFVRPVRQSYVHVGKRPKYLMRDLNPEEHELYGYPGGYVKFEIYPEGLSPSTGRYWTQEGLDSGCGSVTSMGLALAETYAREPGFYGGTFCANCRAHFPVGEHGEFVWEGTDQKVGT